MAEITQQASELLEKALTLSVQDRGLLIDRLIESLDRTPAEPGIEEAWAEEIKHRVEEIRSGKARMISAEEVTRRISTRLQDGKR